MSIIEFILTVFKEIDNNKHTILINSNFLYDEIYYFFWVKNISKFIKRLLNYEINF